MDKSPGKSSSNKIINQDDQEVTLGEQNVRGFFVFLGSPITPLGKIPQGARVFLIIDQIFFL